ncbi:hypothetical protein IJS77_05180 [bacterium]|nr:hypothetical protein [bacterium]
MSKLGEIFNIGLRMPGSKTESGKGKTMAKVGKPIGQVVGTCFFGWCGGSFWGKYAGEDIGGKIGDTINVFS